MSNVFGEQTTNLKEQWQTSQRVSHMLWILPRESWPKYYSGLCDFVRWLHQEKGGQKDVAKFNERVRQREEYLKAEVESGRLSEIEADQKRGDGIWWRAYDEARDAAWFLAFRKIIREKIAAYFDKEPSAAERDMKELRDEIEPLLAEKLRQYVSIEEV